MLPPLRDAAALAGLDSRRVGAAVAPICETVRRVRAGLVAEGFSDCALIGFAGAPFTVACYMVEGGGSHDFSATRAMAYGDPGLFARLMSLLIEATVEYLAAQIEAGAEAIMLFDSWAGVLSPRLFHAHVIQPTAAIVSVLRRRFPMVPVIGFPRLAGLMLGSYATETGVAAVGLDTSMDPVLVARMVPPGIALQGNLDPIALVAGGPVMQREVSAILDALHGRAFVFNLGHGIVPQTLPEHVAALVEQVRAA